MPHARSLANDRSTSHADVATTDRPLTGIQLLLVDDDEANGRLLSTVLTQAGAEVVLAEDGRLGVVAALARPFDAILMDMQMPILDGLGATRQLREKGIAAPIIALSAHAPTDEMDRCLQAGCNSYLSKPVELESFVDSVCAVVRGEASAAFSERRPCAGTKPAETGQDKTDALIHSSLTGKGPSYRVLVRRFVPRLKEMIETLRAAFDERDAATVRELAHKLKGSAGTVGFHGFTEPAQRLMDAARNADWLPGEQTLSEMEDMARRVVAPPPEN